MMYDLETIFLQIPSCVFWKNLNLEFMGGNEHFAKVAGLKSAREIAGKTDYDFPWANSHAQLYREWDRKVLSGLIISHMLEPQLQAGNKLVTVLVNKSPLYNETGQLIGLICNYVEHHSVLRHLEWPVALGKKQRECLTHVANGLTAKQIANEMLLSIRTIESYIDILKKKFSCRNKGELIRKFWMSHFFKGVH